ncbi:hypothetical protein ACFO4O_16270 [Glaciecola siphonariae]|uniref:Pyridine nucleotide transhydrogenase n=1 Tax=Glaciecola siphonariae TaxID=521012 RepID=A0ABV9M0F3_9ALTE
MKKLMAMVFTFACFSASAAQTATDTGNSFSCMNKASFEIDAACMSNKIENSDSFLSSQSVLAEKSTNTNHAMATLTIEPGTLNIEVVAHKDAYLAKVLDQEN